jgi:hypothetical protein
MWYHKYISELYLGGIFMNGIIKTKIDRFVGNYEALRDEFKWSANDYSIRFAAFVYELSGKELSIDKLKDLIKHIKSSTGIFSFHRSTQMLPEAALLLTHFEDGKAAFDKLIKCEDRMKEYGFKSSQYLSIAAYSLLLSYGDEIVDSRIVRAMEIYKKMKEKHSWLTTSDDYPVSVMLSAEDGTIEEINEKIERNYEGLLNENFHKSNGLQYLSHLLTFNPEDRESKVRRCRDVYDKLKEHKLKVSSMYYGTIGFLAMLGEDSDRALYDVVETMDYLGSIKRFKTFYKDLNLTFVCAIINNMYLESRKSNLLEAGVHISVQMLIAAQQAAMIAATSAAAASASASAGS